MHPLHPQNVPTLLFLPTRKVCNGFGEYVLKHIFVVAKCYHFRQKKRLATKVGISLSKMPTFFFLFPFLALMDNLYQEKIKS
jgi:hypothetical protein